MGYAIAQAALERNDQVMLISGPVAIAPPQGARVIRINTADELHDAVHATIGECDVLVMCAAVSDYKPLVRANEKLEKQTGAFTLELTPTRDILASLPREHRSYLVVGFAAETHDIEARAQRKLRAKNCDMIVANDVSRGDSGMESDENEVTIFFANGECKTISRAPKIEIARALMNLIARMHQKSLTIKT